MSSRLWILSAALFLLILLGLAVFSAAGFAPASPYETTTERVSVASNGAQADGDSEWANVSADGRYVAFESRATNLVAGDTNGVEDIFVRDRQTGQTVRVSVASDGTQADDRSGYAAGGPILSSDGRYVVFESEATNLVPGDTNGYTDIFVHDLQTGATQRVSVGTGGVQANYPSYSAWISGDGRYVAFDSRASNLVAGDTNGESDVFVYDRATDTTTRVSVTSGGTQANSASEQAVISADGRYVAFNSWATNLVTGDTNGQGDVFVHDRVTGATTRVSVASNGTQADNWCVVADISGDGRYVLFTSPATTLVPSDTNGRWDVFLHDRQTAQTTRVSVATGGVQANGHSGWHETYYTNNEARLSSDGRYVAFGSEATNLIAGDTNGVWDIFIYDRQASETWRASLAADGSQANGASGYPALSADPRYAGFGSHATNLVAGDTNGARDAFVRGPYVETPTPTPPATPCLAVGPWTEVAPIPTAVIEPAVVSDGYYVYSAGGYNHAVANEVHQFARYDAATDTWTALPDLPVQAFAARGVYANGKIYILGGGIGGSVFGTALQTVQIFDLATQTWSMGADMPEGRARMGGGYFDGKIYVAAGYDRLYYATSSTWAYDIATNTWSGRAPVPIETRVTASGIIDGHLYLVSTEVDDYDIAGNTWTTRPYMTVPRGYPAGVVVAGRLWTIGGQVSGVHSGITEIYDPDTQGWTFGPTQNVPRSGQGAALTIAGRVVSVGGWITQSTSVVESAYAGFCPRPPVHLPEIRREYVSPTPTATPTSTPTRTPTPGNRS